MRSDKRVPLAIFSGNALNNNLAREICEHFSHVLTHLQKDVEPVGLHDLKKKDYGILTYLNVHRRGGKPPSAHTSKHITTPLFFEVTYSTGTSGVAGSQEGALGAGGCSGLAVGVRAKGVLFLEMNIRSSYKARDVRLWNGGTRGQGL